MKSFKNNIPGILVCLAIAVPAWAFGRLVPVIGLLLCVSEMLGAIKPAGGTPPP